MKKLDEVCINTIRMLSVDMVQQANSGHPGMPMGAAPMAYVLWTEFLKHHPKNPKWPDRDRFVLSAGHGSALLYSLLHLTGYDLPMEELKRFRQWGSKTPGHPEYGLTPGVESTTADSTGAWSLTMPVSFGTTTITVTATLGRSTGYSQVSVTNTVPPGPYFYRLVLEQ